MRIRSLATLLLAAGVLTAADDRTADREAIRSHIDRIFQAFIHKDLADLKATHDQNWLGFLEGSRSMIRGLDGYMKTNEGMSPASPYGMTGYKMRDFDMVFKGDAAFVTFVAEVEANTPSGPLRRTLRIADFYTKQDGHWIQSGSDTELHPETVAENLEQPQKLNDYMRKQLLEAREGVWRAYFANDRAMLDKLVPDDLVTIESGGGEFGNHQKVLAGAEQFAKGGGKLVRLEFPKTEIQVYGNTAVVYSTYLYELEIGGKRTSNSGRVTEVFVFRKGQWVNPGWHMDSGK
ncbi:MAG TPA: nuclear transport factor 2 family protein [Bryobacteraceae bacterium]|jgi:ketosteroid isomerase-like protein